MESKKAIKVSNMANKGGKKKKKKKKKLERRMYILVNHDIQSKTERWKNFFQLVIILDMFLYYQAEIV